MRPSRRGAPLPLPHPTQLLIAHIDEPLMSFELTSSQINTLHVAGVGLGGIQSHWKNTLGEKRLQGHGQEGGQEHGQRAWCPKMGEAGGEWVAWGWLHPCCRSSSCCSST